MLDSWILDAIGYTFFQALWSATGATALGFLFSRAVTYRRSGGLLISASLVPYVVPSLLVAFAWVLSYGNNGLVNQVLQGLGWPQVQFLYRRESLIFAHIFVYSGFAWSLIQGAFHRIPERLHDSCSTLGIASLKKFTLLEWPSVRSTVLQTWVLVFLSSLSSFSLALTLGSGPGETTTEVVVYQLIRYEADFRGALRVSLWQLGLGLAFASLTWLVPKIPPFEAQQDFRKSPNPHTLQKSFQGSLFWWLLLGAGAFFLILPPSALLWDALKQSPHWPGLDSVFWKSFAKSLGLSFAVAAGVAVVSPLLGLLLVRKARGSEAKTTQLSSQASSLGKSSQLSSLLATSLGKSSQGLDFGLWVLLAMSPTLLAAAITALAYSWRIDTPGFAPAALFCLQVIFALPVCCRILEEPVLGVLRHRSLLVFPLTPIQRFLRIEWYAYRAPLLLCSSLCFAFSLGETGAASLLAQHSWNPLPVFLLELMGSYRFAEASLVSLILLCLVIVFLLLPNLWKRRS